MGYLFIVNSKSYNTFSSLLWFSMLNKRSLFEEELFFLDNNIPTKFDTESSSSSLLKFFNNSKRGIKPSAQTSYGPSLWDQFQA